MNEDEEGQCKYWDDDGCYCVCGTGCTCIPFAPSKCRVVDTGDELHQILGEALKQTNGERQ